VSDPIWHSVSQIVTDEDSGLHNNAENTMAPREIGSMVSLDLVKHGRHTCHALIGVNLLSDISSPTPATPTSL
jgi:hypothetical protein